MDLWLNKKSLTKIKLFFYLAIVNILPFRKYSLLTLMEFA